MELITLPYAQTDLEPVISAATVGFHYGKHLPTYVNNLNNLLPGSGFEDIPLEEIVRRASGGLFNNAGQVLNHNLYFTQFRAPREENIPVGAFAEQVNRQFGGFDNLRMEFGAKGAGLFGSGWVWLSRDAAGKLVISQEPNAGNPAARGLVPLLTFDVWEHAYYLDWQNRRPDHLAALWQIVDWDVIAGRYAK